MISHELSYFHISWLSETDGPGKRVVLFLQGCPLDCAWCHSPHSQPRQSPLLYFDSLCIRCHRCEEACPNGVHAFIGEQHLILREKCVQCGKCIEACPQSSKYKQGNALVLPTQSKSVGSLFEMLRPQLELLRGVGGITFSGGEPLLQVKALTLLARKCKEAGIHTALETSGIVPLESVETIAPYIDTWLFGMRLTTGTHTFPLTSLEKQTRKVFEFLTHQERSKLIIRIPAIDGYTTTSSYLSRVQEIIGFHPVQAIEVMPLNKASLHYYKAMDIKPEIVFDELQADTAFEMITNYLKTEKSLHYGS